MTAQTQLRSCGRERSSAAKVIPMRIARHGKEREPRYDIFDRATLRVGLRTTDVWIRNISSRGMMLQMASPPKPGTYIELTSRHTSVVGRIVWRSDHKCGIRTREKIESQTIFGIVHSGEPKLLSRKDRSGGPSMPANDASRLIARASEFLVAASFGASLAVTAAFGVYETLLEPFARVRNMLG